MKSFFQSNKLLYYPERCPFTEYVGLGNNINILNMVAVSPLQVKHDAGASCPKFYRASCQL